MEFIAELDAEPTPTSNRLFTEYSFDLEEHKHDQLRRQTQKWRYFSLALSFTFTLLIIELALGWVPEVALLPLCVFDIVLWKWLYCHLKTLEL
jgi:hypothetical protein